MKLANIMSYFFSVALGCGVLCLTACQQQQPEEETDSMDFLVQQVQQREQAPVVARTFEEIPEGTAKNFSEVFDRWEEIGEQEREVVRQARKGNSTSTGDWRKQLRELRAESMDRVMPQLAQAAMAAYESDDEKVKQRAAEALPIVAKVSFSVDRYSTALKAAETLIADDTKDKSMYDIAAAAAFATDQFEKSKEYLAIARKEGVLQRGQAAAAVIDDYLEYWKVESGIRAAEKMTDDLPRVKMETTAGDMVIELYENEAPGAVGNFVSLVEVGYYDGLAFHRVLPGFMAQGGDPTGTGSGGPGYNILCECDKPDARMHFAGTLSMAHAGKDTGGSQFFLTFLPTPHLNNRHTVFGRVIEGMDVMEKLKRVDPQRGGDRDSIIKATVIRKRDHEYRPSKAR